MTTAILLGPYGGPEWKAVMPRLGLYGAIHPIVDSDFSTTAHAVLKTAPDRFHAVGFCSGAQVVFELLRQAPGRLSSLVLINSTARADDERQASVRRDRIDKLKAQDADLTYNNQAYIDRALTWMLAPPKASVRRDAAACLRALPRSSAIAQQSALLRRPDCRHLLPHTDIRTLVIGGEEDRICPAVRSREIAALLPKAHLMVYEKCGHMSLIERPEEVGAALTHWFFQDP